MIDSLITSAVVSAVAIVGVGVQLYFAHRRWAKQDEEVARERAERDAEFAARVARQERALAAPLELPPWTPWQPDPRESEERLQRMRAEMDAVAHEPELERSLAEFWATVGSAETKPALPANEATAPLDLSERVNERLSEAGYTGGPLRVTRVELLEDGGVNVYLEAVTT